ncbi:MAG: hypothetical protein LV480_05530 [Methylacidiphilales bacterium]|nr:hypothetical protein [Candidatus Methylacidiphilales bacterium]
MKKDFDLLHVRIVGFCGQQTLYHPSAVAEALRRQLEKMETPGRRLMALSPLAGPADLIFAKEALGLSIPLVIVATLPREELRKNFFDQAAADFDQIMQKATKTETLLLTSQHDAATRVGQKLVDEADVLLAVSDEAGTSADGDAAEVISYATRRGRPVICLRETANGVVVHEIKPGKDQAEPLLSVDELEKMLGEPPASPELPEGLVKYFHACDKLATHTAPRVRRYVLNIVLANATASVAGSVGSSFTHSSVIGTILTVIKFGCIFLGLGIFAVLRHRQSRNHWLTLRLKAEVCRSAIATWSSPSAIEPLTADEVPELRQLLQALRYFRATRHHAHPEISLEAFKAAYGYRRLIDQYRYFEHQAELASTMSSRLTPLYWILSGAALLASGGSLILQSFYEVHHPLGRLTNFIFVFVPIVAPALASWIIAWQAIESVSRKQARFAEMKRLMHQALVDLIHSHSWESTVHVVKHAERQLLAEVLEWYSFVKYSS